MVLKCIGSVRFLKLSENGTRSILKDMFVSDDSGILKKEFLTEEFKNVVGLAQLETFGKFPFCYFVDESYEGGVTKEEIRSLHNYLSFFIQAYLHFLWLIKDNSCQLDSSHVYIIDGINIKIGSSYDVIKNKNCEGKSLETEFTWVELLEAKSLYDKYEQITLNHITNSKKKKNYTSSNLFYYNDSSRINRAMYFLTIARANAFLPLKISVYMALLESLFNTSDAEITHKIAERVSFYLGSNKEDRLSIFYIVKDGYNLRSKYFHGQMLNKYKTHEEQAEFSIKIDTIIRKLLVKIIKDDSQKILMQNEDLEKWLTEIIF